MIEFHRVTTVYFFFGCVFGVFEYLETGLFLITRLKLFFSQISRDGVDLKNKVKH